MTEDVAGIVWAISPSGSGGVPAFAIFAVVFVVVGAGTVIAFLTRRRRGR